MKQPAVHPLTLPILTELGRFSPALSTCLVGWPSALQEVEIRKSPIEGLSLWVREGGAIIADHPTSEDPSAVFPPHPESVFLAGCVGAPYSAQRALLDVGTGSGILGLEAAKRGWQVRAIDVNQRAVEVASLNARLWRLDMEVVLRDFRSETDQFDVILANLPFEPTPPGYRNYLHSSGGSAGLEVVADFLPKLKDLLTDEGFALIPAFALEIDDGESSFYRLLEQVLPSGLSFHVLVLSDRISTKVLLGRYDRRRRKQAEKEWLPGVGENFRVELAICRKGGMMNVPPRIFSPVASIDWVLPLAVRQFGVPMQADR